MNIPLKMDKDFEKAMTALNKHYGEDFEYLNGFHEMQLNFSDFIDSFIDKNVADVTIDANANASNKDIRSLLNEKGKSHDKLFAFNKIFYEMKKRYNLNTAKEWLETEYNGGFYLHDASTSTYLPYCFSGDTQIMTKIGLRRLDELNGMEVSVLNKNHDWEKAMVKCFGRQELKRLTLTRCGVEKSFLVTGKHKWFVVDDSGNTAVLDTDQLKPDMRIPFNMAKTWSDIKPSLSGIAHGFFIGDGGKGELYFCGDKQECEKNTSNAFTKLPDLSEPVEYLYGWLAGYFAADGSIDDKGRCTISSSNKEYLEFARDVLCVLGMPVNEIRCQNNVNNLTNEMCHVYVLTLSGEYLREDFFIRPSHKEKWIAKSTGDRKHRAWIVKNVESTDITDNVYCAVAEKTQSFTLDGNVLTHNCYAYDLTKLATDGLFFLKNYNNQAPKHLTTFMDDVIEYISYMSNRSSGAVGIPNVLIWTYYFWKKDCESGYLIKNPEYYIKQCFQKFIYRLNQPFMRIIQTAFVNVSIFDRNYIEALFGGVQYPDGTYVIDCIEELIEHQKLFMEVVSQIRSENMFTFPVKVIAA